MANSVLEKGQLTKLFIKGFFRKENLLRGYGIQTSQGRVTWGFIVGAVVVQLPFGVYLAALFVVADALNALWIGMQKNGYYQDPSQIMEVSS